MSHTSAVFLYDGDCGFCTRCAEFIEKRIPTRADVVAWQHADLEPLGVSQEQAEEAVQWIAAGRADPARPAQAGPEAIACLLVDAGGFWRPLGRALRFAPVRMLAWRLYRVISRNRHRLPGGTPVCSLPQAQRNEQR